MLNSILVGLLLSMATIGIHGLGTVNLLLRLQKKASAAKHEVRSTLSWQLGLLTYAGSMLLMLHILEVLMWGLVYLFLVGTEPIDTLEKSMYFSTVSFTSLGYGDIVLDEPWRLLSAIQAMIGILIFGWSTALIFAVVQRIWLTDELHAQHDDAR